MNTFTSPCRIQENVFTPHPSNRESWFDISERELSIMPEQQKDSGPQVTTGNPSTLIYESEQEAKNID